ncbi:hypothetical protein [Pseudophaeobacter sp. EL27]|uniref:hypothetical protein n=1 Tax=Pseudophaeobacter sp. EL27 TaxID=2107580 RepID=UPI0013C3EC31|nr:hypothetical protein [Pseudophaeobacter sp. EL27]
MKSTHATPVHVQPKDLKRPVARLSPHDLAGIRSHGSAASAVELAGWLRRIFRK